MRNDDILSRTFAEHEHLAPDADAVLAGLRDRPRRVLPVAATVTTVAAVAIGASILLDRSPAPTTPTGAPRPAASSAAARVVPVPATIALAAGRLPAGTATPSLTASSYGEQLRGYDVVGPDGTSTSVLLTARPGTALPTENKRGTPRDVTIGGRPGREWSGAGWYTAAVRGPGGRVVQVDLTSYEKDGDTPVPAAGLAAVGRDVLAHVRLDRKEEIPTAYTLTYAPAGLVGRAVSTDQDGTRYELAGPTAPAGSAAVYVEPAEGSWAGGQKGKPRPPAKPGRPVQGRPTFIVTTSAGPELFVDELRPGVSITLSAGAPLAELYKIADGIRWTS
jgi:hypothetical protein